MLCLDKSKSVWTEENAILHLMHDADHASCQPEVAYLLTSLTLKRTICGEIRKGVLLKRVDESVVSNDIENRSKISEYNDRLYEMTDECVAIKVDRRTAMKRIHQSERHRNPENPWKEVAAMQLLGNDHPNVMGLLGAFADNECLYEVMRFCSGGTLSEFIRSHPMGLPEEMAQNLFKQILDGVYHIHSHGVCHHDISSDNVLLDENGSCVIIDFGMSLRVPYSYPDDPWGATDDVTDNTVSFGKRRLIHTEVACGKMRFVAPEIYRKAPAFDGFASDIWSLGIVLFAMLTGRCPYDRPEDNDSGYHDLVDPNFYWSEDDVDPCLSWGHPMSLAAKDLMRNMLRPDPRDRATLGWISKHKWVVITPKPEHRDTEILVQ